MTDYLEELLDHAGELLEQVRRTEGGGPLWNGENGADHAPLSPAPAPSETASPLSAEGNLPSDPALERVDAHGRQPETDSPSPRREEAQTGLPARPRASSEDDPLPSPLLEQMRRMERAAGFSLRPAPPETFSPSRGGEEYPLSLTRPAGGGTAPQEPQSPGWTGTLGPVRSLPPPGGTLNWAEEADRAFRRDSRRYDGGFYLY